MAGKVIIGILEIFITVIVKVIMIKKVMILRSSSILVLLGPLSWELFLSITRGSDMRSC